MRLAAIDIGTNSVHMIVVQVRPDRSFEVIDREKEMVRLGAGGLDGKALTPGAMSAALQALSKFKRLADAHRVDEILAGATSATREAENGGDFLAAIAAQTGIRARVISAKDEARLIHTAAAYGADTGRRPVAAIDIGGGSVEVTYGTSTRAQLADSFKLGVIRLTERFVRSDPLTKRDEQRLVKFIEHAAGDHLDAIGRRGVDRVIGTSGTILSLGTLAAREAGQSVEDVRNLRVPVKAIHRLRRRLLSLDLRERLQLSGLDPRRADLAPAGIVLLDTLLSRLGVSELVLSDFALREGLVLDYMRRNRSRIAAIDRYPDARRRSVMELGERCHYWSDHTRHVAHLALGLFDASRQLHALGDREREWLEYGALLHDVGVHISYKGHHRHSYYLVRHGDLRGFEPEEIEIVALIARYHRRSPPRKSHEAFRALPAPARRAVKVLAAFVRLAEALDRSHAQLVAGVELFDGGDHVIVRLTCRGDAELELWAAHRQLRALEDVLGRVVRLELTRAGAPSALGAPDGRPTTKDDEEPPDSPPARRRGRMVGA
ncbi:MAG: Ppx/GppA phosphatase family protein [Candidatus Binatia bacterium]